MWTAGFVLLTLIVNAPLLPWVLRITGLSKGMALCLACHWPLILGLPPRFAVDLHTSKPEAGRAK